ncbi:MAG: metallophosphoesterase, partial [Phycisphaerae bacterium]|nr:metallophosphoesterase [Phycisphaerae bacterium]
MRNRICLMWMLLTAGLVILPCIGEPPAEQVLTPAPENSFSIVVIPDTQMYHGQDTKRTPKSTEPVTNAIFESHVRWIAENRQTQRIAFVSHVGDIVDRNNDTQWTVARKWMDLLHGKVPYGLCPGNHDMTHSGDSSLFQKYFGAERFKDFDWYGGSYSGDPKHPGHSGNNADSYQLFSAEGLDFVILHLECNAPNGVLKWADTILRKYPDRIA